MEHVKAILIKFLMIAAVLLIILAWIFNVPFGDTILISAILTVLAYLLGDLMIFRKAGDPDERSKRNVIATVSDIILAFLAIWLVGDAMVTDTTGIIAAAIVSSVIIGSGEWFFHIYLDRNVFPDEYDNPAATH